MKIVLWFSRHEMTSEQREALGDVEIGVELDYKDIISDKDTFCR